MKKKGLGKIFLCFILGLLLLLCSCSTNLSTESKSNVSENKAEKSIISATEMGQKYKEVLTKAESDATYQESVAKVNGVSISKKDFEFAKVNANYIVRPSSDSSSIQPMKSDEEVLKNLIKNEVINQLAAKQGIEISDDEILKLIVETHKQIEENVSTVPGAKESYELYTQVAKSMGISMNEYQVVVELPGRKKIELENKLYFEFMKTQPEEIQNDRGKSVEAFNQYVEQEIEKADVQIFLK